MSEADNVADDVYWWFTLHVNALHMLVRVNMQCRLAIAWRLEGITEQSKSGHRQNFHICVEAWTGLLSIQE